MCGHRKKKEHVTTGKKERQRDGDRRRMHGDGERSGERGGRSEGRQPTCR